MTAPTDGPRRRRPGPPEGSPTVFAADEQSSGPVDVAHLVRVAEGVLADEGVRGECELSLYFVEEPVIADLNERFLGGRGPTDVLAFPIDDELTDSGRSPDAGTSGPDRAPLEVSDVPVLLGDVVVCPAVARRNVEAHAAGADTGGRHAGTVEDELALLVVHGTLHVLGMDHGDPTDEAAMQAREQELLARHHRGEGG